MESHVGEMFYQPDRNRYRLETTDKFLKASVTIMQSNPLVGSKVDPQEDPVTNQKMGRNMLWESGSRDLR